VKLKIRMIVSIIVASILGLTVVYLVDLSTRDVSISNPKPYPQPLDRSSDIENQKILSGGRDTATTISRSFELYSLILALVAASTISYIVRRRFLRF